MYLTQALTAALLLNANLVAAGPATIPKWQAQTSSPSFNRHNATLEDFSEYALTVAKSRVGSSNSSSTCTPDKLSVRKSWHDLTVDERKAYTSAVLCLQAKEPQTPSSLAPGAKTRYDDWIVTHINQTYTIHFNANFLGWHRWFIWEHEQALRNECGYTGYLPYWDWTKTAESGLSNSPIFDGSDSSMSGDGASMNYTSSDEVVINAGTAAEMHFPAGTGGGCVTSGPFVNYTLNLGPDGLAMVNEDGLDNSSYPFQYNPRCLQRSLTDHVNQRYANSSSVLTLLRDPQDVWTFETLMSGDSAYPELGVHGGGHWSLGGDPGRDLFVSPGDPVFFLHHANVDRVWWQWQMQDIETRVANWTTAVNGPYTMHDETEPHRNGTAKDVYDLGFAVEGKTHKLGELLETTSQEFCYVYE